MSEGVALKGWIFSFHPLYQKKGFDPTRFEKNSLSFLLEFFFSLSFSRKASVIEGEEKREKWITSSLSLSRFTKGDSRARFASPKVSLRATKGYSLLAPREKPLVKRETRGEMRETEKWEKRITRGEGISERKWPLRFSLAECLAEKEDRFCLFIYLFFLFQGITFFPIRETNLNSEGLK